VDEQAGQGRSSRRAGLRPLPTPTDVEIYVDDAPPLLEVIDELPEPRIAELDALLREVDTLRDTLRRDLTLAATAAEAGADDLAGWLLLGEDGAVRAFEERALSHLSALEAADDVLESPAAVIPTPRRAARMMPAAPLVAAAAAVVGFLTGAIPGVGGPTVTSPRTSNSALQSYSELTRLASAGASASSISAAAERFHSDLAPLVATAGSDPAAAQRAIDLLQSERAVIAGEADSPALRAVLAQADLLVRKLRATLPRSTRVGVPAAPVTHDGRSSSSQAPKSSPAPKASPSPSPKASPKQSPSPSSSGHASPSPSSSSGPIPGAPVPH
jgi:hypothetical protein